MAETRPPAEPAERRGDCDEPEHVAEPAASLCNRKSYAAPELLLWGTLAEITEKLGGRGSPDGGRSKNQNKTRP